MLSPAALQGQPYPPACGEAMAPTPFEVPAGARTVVVDAADIAILALERGAAVAVPAQLEVAVAGNHQQWVRFHHRVAARDGHGVVGGAAAGAAVLAVELARLPALAG